MVFFSGDNLRRSKDGVHVINLDHKQSKGKQWVLLFIDRYKAVCLLVILLKLNIFRKK